uniref:Uncharacterized protein n=1 Tax=Arion vulgaris TaxID=1028688 RepID=A0A0B6YXE7_9EUPU
MLEKNLKDKESTMVQKILAIYNEVKHDLRMSNEVNYSPINARVIFGSVWLHKPSNQRESYVWWFMYSQIIQSMPEL